MTGEPQDKKDALQGVFTRTASTYGAIPYFPIFGEWLVDVADIREGAQVLDVASGRGAVLFPAAARVGPRGRVVGTDLAEGMARETQAEIERRGLSQAEMRQMDAEHLDFPDESFDNVLCGFALQFFPHLDRALAEFRRVLHRGGSAVVTTWAGDDSRWDWYDELRDRYGAVVKLGSQTLDSPEVIREWFTAAGYTDLRIESKAIEIHYADEEEWWNVEWSISGRAGLEKLSPDALRDLKAEAFKIMQPQKEAQGYPVRLEAFCTVALRS